jgi:hypothetical protein
MTQTLASALAVAMANNSTCRKARPSVETTAVFLQHFDDAEAQAAAMPVADALAQALALALADAQP